jgi:hypothetical protein
MNILNLTKEILDKLFLSILFPRITALDPARVGFEPGLIFKPVDRLSATFVNVVHTDPGGYAMNTSAGHVDFWPNYKEFIDGSKLQPGCSKESSTQEVLIAGSKTTITLLLEEDLLQTFSR